MKRISQLTELTTPALDDEIPIVDKSTSTTKRIKVSNLVGIPDFGWTASAETWAYSSWSASTRIGVLTVPTDATVKYQAGMRIKITQSTGGTKYGIIVKVASTELTVFFPSGTTLNNETVSDAQFSSVKVPFGFNASPDLWTLRTEFGTSRATTSTSLASLTDTVTVPIGSWRFLWHDTVQLGSSTTSSLVGAMLWSSNASSMTNQDLVAHIYQRAPSAVANNQADKVSVEDTILASSSMTFTLMGVVNAGTLTANRTTEPASIPQKGTVRLISGYL